ncbi:exsB protein [Alicycliphilus sp. B1]|nr:exsB protein [Alicycliphilus sp. B1]
MFGQALDTAAFFAIAFWRSSNAFMAAHWVEIAWVDYAIKLGVSLLLFVPAYGVLLGGRRALAATRIPLPLAGRAMSAPDRRRALVLLSGGQDSATCLAWALARYADVETIGFDYGQRHRAELDCPPAAARGPAGHAVVRAGWGLDHLLTVDVLAQLGGSAMTEEVAIAMQQDGLPNTFVPGRNLLFFTLAAALAYRRGLQVLVGGMSETDYSGYPDCRDNTLKALQVALSLGLDRPLTLETPLMWIDKAGTWALAHQLGGDALVELDQARFPHLLPRPARPAARLGLRLRQAARPASCAPRAGRSGQKETALLANRAVIFLIAASA